MRRRTHIRNGNRTSTHGRAAWLLVLLCLVVCAAAAGWVLLRVMDAGATSEERALQDETREWDETVAPNYYQVVGPACFDEVPEVGEVIYEPLDALGRAGRVIACVDYALMEAGRSREREPTNDLLPSGWGDNAEVEVELPNGNTYHGYFWNRSHLLAKSLGGEEVIENLVCGTRMQNVGANVEGVEGGMAYAESLTRDWLEENPRGNVLYAARPLYRGSELVCRNVLVDVRSSDGALDFEVLVFNAAKGYEIDYETGEFRSGELGHE